MSKIARTDFIRDLQHRWSASDNFTIRRPSLGKVHARGTLPRSQNLSLNHVCTSVVAKSVCATPFYRSNPVDRRRKYLQGTPRGYFLYRWPRHINHVFPAALSTWSKYISTTAAPNFAANPIYDSTAFTAASKVDIRRVVPRDENRWRRSAS